MAYCILHIGKIFFAVIGILNILTPFLPFQFLSIWTILTSTFDVYCLHEAKPGSSHTGFYIFSFDFVYVGNPHSEFSLINVPK